MLEKKKKRIRRHKRIRARVFGTSQRPRLSVSRSAKHIYAQLVDDEKGKTILSASDRSLAKTRTKKTKVETAKEVGKILGKSALSKKIEKVVFDRGGYKYQGRIKALAEGAREEGLKF